MNMHTQSYLLGFGYYVPERVLSNVALEGMVDTSDEWITTRTGIKERRIVSQDQACSDLALQASEQALEHAGQRCPEVVIGESSYSTVILIGTWVFSIIRDAQHATHRANQVQLKQGEVRGGATVRPSQNPLAVALWLARVQRALAEHKGHIDLVDDDGRAIDPSFRDEAILLGEWGTDFETLRPALEHLELVEQKIDLGSLQAPVADNWF